MKKLYLTVPKAEPPWARVVTAVVMDVELASVMAVARAVPDDAPYAMPARVYLGSVLAEPPPRLIDPPNRPARPAHVAPAGHCATREESAAEVMPPTSV